MLAPLFGAGASEKIGSCLSRVLAGQLDLLTGLGLGGGDQAGEADPAASRAGKARRVGISLMLSAETETAVELVREQMPDAAVGFRGPYCKIERDGTRRSFDVTIPAGVTDGQRIPAGRAGRPRQRRGA